MSVNSGAEVLVRYATEYARRSATLRTRRRLLKGELELGHVRLSTVLVDPPEWADGMRVRELLLALPGVRQVKVDRALHKCGISAEATLGELPLGKAQRILEYFYAHHPDVWRRWEELWNGNHNHRRNP